MKTETIEEKLDFAKQQKISARANIGYFIEKDNQEQLAIWISCYVKECIMCDYYESELLK